MTTPDALFDSPDAQRHADSIARRILRRLPRGHFLLGELRCAALEGLWQASRSFDPSRGLAFSTHARHRIRGAVLDWLRERDRFARGHYRKGDAAPQSVSLSDGAEGRALVYALLDDDDPPGSRLETADLADAVTRNLSWRERFILSRCYTDGWTQHRIGKALGVHEHYVSLLHAVLLEKLRARLAERGLLEG